MNELYTQTNIQWLEQCLAAIREGEGIEGYVYLLHFAAPLGQPQTAEKRAAYGLPPRQQPPPNSPYLNSPRRRSPRC